MINCPADPPVMFAAEVAVVAVPAVIDDALIQDGAPDPPEISN